MKELSSFLDYAKPRAVALTFQDQTKSFGGGWANTTKLSLFSCLQFEKPSCFERNEIVRLFTWYVWNSCTIHKDIRPPTDATSPFPLSLLLSSFPRPSNITCIISKRRRRRRERKSCLRKSWPNWGKRSSSPSAYFPDEESRCRRRKFPFFLKKSEGKLE